MVTKVNPVFVNEPRCFLGKTLTELSIDFNVDADGSTGPDGAIAKAIQAVQERVTIAMYSSITGTGELMTVFVEGEFPEDTYDGTNSETFAAYVQTVIRALGTVDSIDLGGAVVTAGVVYKADQV